MSRETALAVTSVVFFLTTASFAAIFAYQYLKNDESVTSPPATVKPADSNDAGSCPYYPTPQKIDFTKDGTFAEFLAWLDKYINSMVDKNSRPSVSANLVYLDEIVWSGYFGKLSKETDEKPDKDTIYRIASVSKIFPVLYLFKLWEDNRLDLYDPVTKYAPDFTLQPGLGTTDDINLIDIASQISGLPGFLPFDLTKGETGVVFDGDLEDALALLRNQTLAAKPRERCIYSNLAYALLGSILARNFSEGTFTEWAQKNVVDVLGLNNTGFTFTETVRKRMASGYFPNGTVAPIFDFLWYGPTGNYYSSLGDLTQLSMSFLETSKQAVLKHETLTEMMRPRKTCRHGYLAGLDTDLTGSPWEMNVLHENLVVKKMGAIPGYSSTMALVPSLKLSFNLLMSGLRGENVAQKVLDKAIPVFRNALRRLEQKVNPTPDPGKYTGVFTYHLQQNLTIKVGKDEILLMENPQFEPARFNTTGFSYVSEAVFRIIILGGEFPCTGIVDAQNGAIVQFKNLENGKYNQLDIPSLFMFDLERI